MVSLPASLDLLKLGWILSRERTDGYRSVDTLLLDYDSLCLTNIDFHLWRYRLNEKGVFLLGPWSPPSQLRCYIPGSNAPEDMCDLYIGGRAQLIARLHNIVERMKNQ